MHSSQMWARDALPGGFEMSLATADALLWQNEHLKASSCWGLSWAIAQLILSSGLPS